MAQVILVHGIAQEQFSADSLEKDWIPALAGGVRTAGYPKVADCLWRLQPPRIETRMAFYGDLFLRADEQGSGAELSEAEESEAEALAETWLERAAARSSNLEERSLARRELAALRGATGMEEQGAGRFFRRAVRRVGKLRWFAPYGMAFAQRFVVKALAQVTRYFENEDLRAAALQRVLDLIDSNTQVIVGHSLGSIVAYEAVQKIRARIPLLVTIGSPLGLDTFVYPRLRPQPPAFPPFVQRWVNVADPDDLVAAEPDLAGFFSSGIPAGADFEGLRTVDNGAKPHSAEFYLTKMEVGRSVGEVLT